MTGAEDARLSGLDPSYIGSARYDRYGTPDEYGHKHVVGGSLHTPFIQRMLSLAVTETVAVLRTGRSHGFGCSETFCSTTS